MSVNLADQLGGRLLVIFDGYCGLCNRSVHWLLRRDRHDRLRFAPSESPKVAGWLADHGFSTAAPATGQPTGPGTIVVVCDMGGHEERALVRSDAAVALLKQLPQPWPIAAALLRCIPRPLRDTGYRLVARWRYRVWGRLESCPLPGEEERGRFL